MTRFFCLLACAAFAFPVSSQAGGKLDDHSLWQESLKEQVFPDTTIQDGSSFMTLKTPYRALDAAIVPIALQFKEPEDIKNVSFVIDHNPSPFVIAIDTSEPNTHPDVRLRVRIDSYTYLRAIAETKSGEFFQVANFVKAAGGCSAPSLSGMAEAEKYMGQMKVKFIERNNGWVKARLMVRHPNYSGFQFDQISRSEIPAHFIDSVVVSSNGRALFTAEPSISISENPVFTFLYRESNTNGTVDVAITDNKGNVYEGSWQVPQDLAEVAAKN
ncbi:MAG: quinoprotein dehydrogenase-associated SoxYZ-like carrier [Alphaproteobacteria bacterium GM202ARS2]|nr:quinoprotein dehydrogenase-associated SoxYZ-like carrier [Alphaproteobacteria bacterium GM202ARS2]